MLVLFNHLYLNRLVRFPFHRHDAILVLGHVHIVGGRIEHVLPPMIVQVVRLIVTEAGFIEFIGSPQRFTDAVIIFAQTITLVNDMRGIC